MSKRTLSVTVDGKTFSRTTDAPYTHVVIWRQNDGSGKVGIGRWSKSRSSAMEAKAAAESTASRCGSPATFEVMEVAA